MKIWSKMDGDERDEYLSDMAAAIDELQATMKLGPHGDEKTGVKIDENKNKGAVDRTQQKKKG